MICATVINTETNRHTNRHRGFIFISSIEDANSVIEQYRTVVWVQVCAVEEVKTAVVCNRKSTSKARQTGRQLLTAVSYTHLTLPTKRIV